MNFQLMEQIVHHIFCNLGVLPSIFVDSERTQSLIDKNYLLDRKLSFITEDQQTIKNPVYGCQVMIDTRDFKILVGDCSQDPAALEYAAVVQLDGMPAYGLYTIYGQLVESNSLIAVSINDKDWMPCNTFLQATFLTAMEQLKDLHLAWTKCANYQKHYDMLVSLITFQSYYEADNEG